jgi:hypothetical protein
MTGGMNFEFTADTGELVGALEAGGRGGQGVPAHDERRPRR